MYWILIGSITLSILVSACCSLMEAALYAVPYPFVKHRAELGGRSGKILLRFKNSMRSPIAAILILNTIANTAGASVAGWAVGEIFGSHYLAIFSVCFTLAVLYMSEILPKMVGVVYCKSVASFVAQPLQLLVTLVKPLIMVSDLLSGAIKDENNEPKLSAQEFLSMAALGTEEGALDHLEGSVIKNVVRLDQILVKQVLTPRVVVFRLEENTTIGAVENEICNWNFSRVPIYSESNPDFLSGYATQRDIYRELIKGNRKTTLREIARPLKTVPEVLRVDQLLQQMFEEREHICAVVDEHGGLAGIITLEDIVEELIGQEIIDEYDTVSDLRTFAKLKWFTRHRKS